jgi:hypothetical protein
MTIPAEATDVLDPHVEGWIWWALLVIGLIIISIAVAVLRRRFVQPMRHTPSDTTDSWQEAGRRLATPPADDIDRPEEPDSP